MKCWLRASWIEFSLVIMLRVSPLQSTDDLWNTQLYISCNFTAFGLGFFLFLFISPEFYSFSNSLCFCIILIWIYYLDEFYRLFVPLSLFSEIWKGMKKITNKINKYRIVFFIYFPCAWERCCIIVFISLSFLIGFFFVLSHSNNLFKRILAFSCSF